MKKKMLKRIKRGDLAMLREKELMDMTKVGSEIQLIHRVGKKSILLSGRVIKRNVEEKTVTVKSTEDGQTYTIGLDQVVRG